MLGNSNSVLRCGPSPDYNPASVSQPSSYMKRNKSGVNTFRTNLDGEVLELHERSPMIGRIGVCFFFVPGFYGVTPIFFTPTLSSSLSA